MALWPEDSSYSWCGSKQLLGQGAEIVTGTERPPGSSLKRGSPPRIQAVFFLFTPSLVLPVGL